MRRNNVALALEVHRPRAVRLESDATSIPVEERTARIHFEKVVLEIVLCGLVKLINSRVSFPLSKGCARLSYKPKTGTF